ncbi:MAG TPA: phosphate ABC transporter ATP-binding protein [Alphaproteobacteria bacterium]|nr:phosphate ABC transporter ATP-binding protein [Alphaproteobacteria bacterium]
MATVPTILPLRLESVSKTARGLRIIDGVSCEFVGDSRSLILGANGAGKSVLLRLCHGLLQPSEGKIVWHGANGVDPSHRQAMVFQRPIMLRRSALANVIYALKLGRVPRANRRERAAMALARVGLAEIADRPARVLSGGEQQRLALSRAWALEPEVLFLDEPTANLDPTATRAVEEIIQQIADAGTKIVMTTHNLGQARRLADEILFIHRGRLLEKSPADRFFAAPASPEGAAFLKEELPW